MSRRQEDTMGAAPAPPSTLRIGTLPIVVIAALAVLLLLWSTPGLNMFPLDDGWVMFSSKSLDWNLREFFLGNSREMRVVPYLIARAVENDGFRTANLLLIGLDLAIFVGLFAVFERVLRGRALAAFVGAGLAMLFPGDPTMFWLGAFGVNISYACLLWSTWASLVAIERRSWWLQGLALALLYCGVRTYPGYVFLPLVLVFHQVLVSSPRKDRVRDLLRHCLPQYVVFALALVPTVTGMLAGTGREGHVASLDPALALAGYRSMFGHLTQGWLASMLDVTSFPLAYTLAFALVFAATLALLAMRSRQAPATRVADAPLLLVAAALVLILACYLPYSISDVRFGAGRALTGSRAGLFLLLAGLGDWLWRRSPRPRWAGVAVIGAVVVLLCITTLSQLALFQDRYRQSLFQRVLLADLAAVMPCPPATPILLFTAPKTLGRHTGGTMLINRIQFPVRTMYGRNDIRIASANNYMLIRSGRIDPADGTVVYRGLHLGTSPLLFRYDFEHGFRNVRRLPVRVGHERRRMMIRGEHLAPQRCEATPLMRALLDRSARNRAALGLPAPDWARGTLPVPAKPVAGPAHP